MSEAFAKTLDHGHSALPGCPNPPWCAGLVSTWIDDYNTAYPHSALAMCSSVEVGAALDPSQTVR